MALLRSAFCRWSGLRGLCTGQDSLLITKNESTGFVTVSMSRPPVNSINLDMLEKLRDTFSELEKTKCKGMILTSEIKSVFTAGLDIMEMYNPTPERLRKYWTVLQDTWINLYASSYPTVAVINGHSPAGGCLWAVSCEYRIMVGPKFTIGPNEAQVGIIAPRWFRDCIRNTVGERRAELALTGGKRFRVDEALKIGLIDEVAKDKADALQRAEKFLLSMSNTQELARSEIKKTFRQDTLNRLLRDRESDIKFNLFFISQPITQKNLEMYIESIKGKKG